MSGGDGSGGGVQVEALDAAGTIQLGEGPHWVDSEQALYYVDLLAGVFHRLHPGSGLHTSATPPGKSRPLGFVVPVRKRPGLFVAGLGTELVLLRWDGKTSTCDVVSTLGEAKSKHAIRFNDGKADPTGRLWAGECKYFVFSVRGLILWWRQSFLARFQNALAVNAPVDNRGVMHLRPPRHINFTSLFLLPLV
jgi:sugar lactone lactonase YvrE